MQEAEEEAAQYSSELNRLQGLLSESKSMRDRAFGLEEQLMAMRDKSRLMLEEKEREVEALQATIRQLQLMHGAGQLPNQQQQGVNTTGGGGVKGVMSNLVSPSNSFTSSVEQQLKSKIVGLERELRDSEKTHELRSIAEQALKDELSSTRAVLQMASSGDNSYMALRAAIVSGLEQGMFVSKPGHMFTMLSRMLQLSPQEIKRVEAGASKAK